MADAERALYLAMQVLQTSERYPLWLTQAAVMLLLDPDSTESQSFFLELYESASTTKAILVGSALPFPPDETTYYDPTELNRPGIEIGIEPVNNGWTLKLFPEQLRRHCLVTGMTGSGKTNLLQLIALQLGEIDR